MAKLKGWGDRVLYDMLKAGAGFAWSSIVGASGIVGWLAREGGMSEQGAMLWAGLASVIVFGLVAAVLYRRWGQAPDLKIHSARWGPVAEDKRAWLQTQVSEGGTIEAKAKSKTLGDPMSGVKKQLIVVYSRGDGEPTEVVFNEGEHVRIG